MGLEVFSGCTSLKSITIPDSVKFIGENAFDRCHNLTIKCHKDSDAHEYAIRRDIPVNLIESLSESRISSSEAKDYRVVTVAMDVAMPADKRLEDYGAGGGGPSGPNSLFRRLSGTLASVGLEMAGDYIDSVGEVTQFYKDNDYEFFTESASLKEGTDSLRSKFLRIMKEIDEETPMDQESADRFWDKWYLVIEPLFDYSDEEGPDDSYYKYYSQVEVPDEVMKQVIDIYSKEFSESLKEDAFDYDENSEEDQDLWDMCSTKMGDEFLDMFGIPSDAIGEQDWTRLIDALVRIHKVAEK